jgi:hypothetical protein
MAAGQRSSKKDKSQKREKEKPEPTSDDESSDGDEEEEEEVESIHVKRKRERGRASFFRLLRTIGSFMVLGMVISKQPFMVRPRQSGVNAAKVRPLEIAIAGAVHWAADSPMVMRNPKIAYYLNETSRVLLAPHEYASAQQSKRAMPNEKTVQGAYKKTIKTFQRLCDKDTAVREMIGMPMPNFVLIGSYLLVAGSLFAVLSASVFEYLVIGGCIMLTQGGRGLGLEPQPELYVTAVLAGICVFLMESASKAGAPTKAKRR